MGVKYCLVGHRIDKLHSVVLFGIICEKESGFLRYVHDFEVMNKIVGEEALENSLNSRMI